MLSVLLVVALVVVMTAGGWTDVTSRRIPNSLTVAGTAIALLVRSAMAVTQHDGPPPAPGAAGLLIAFAVTFPLFALRGLGGGDVKLLMAAGAFLGVERIVPALLLSAVAGGVMGLVQAWRRGVILPVFLGCRDLIVHCVTFGRSGARPQLSAESALTVPYGVAIAVGSVASLLLAGRL